MIKLVQASVPTKQFEALELTISLSMTVADWRRFQAGIRTASYPDCDVSRAIDKVLSKFKEGTEPYIHNPIASEIET